MSPIVRPGRTPGTALRSAEALSSGLVRAKALPFLPPIAYLGREIRCSPSLPF